MHGLMYIFVEGINDARMLMILFYGEPRNYNRKIIFEDTKPTSMKKSIVE